MKMSPERNIHFSSFGVLGVFSRSRQNELQQLNLREIVNFQRDKSLFRIPKNTVFYVSVYIE